MLTVFFDNILPIFIVAGCGFALRRWAKVDTRMLSRATFYVFSPCLLFSGLVGSSIELNELAGLASFAVAQILIMCFLGWLTARLLRLGRAETSLLILAAMSANAGNYGLALNELRYGAEGVARAIPYFTITGIFGYTLGIVIISMGRRTLRESIVGLTKLPIIYAIGLALPIFLLDLPLPSPIFKATEIAGRGAVPIMLIVLGMQLADMRSLESLRMAIPATFLRIGVTPFVAAFIAGAVGLQGVGYAASILEASMPVAVFTTILTTEFDVLPKAMTTTVIISTLLSPLTLALVIQLLSL